MAVVWAALAAVTVALAASEDPEVKTTSGILQGFTLDAEDVKLNVFLGIPFAKPPLDSLRYAAPIPIDSPSDIVNATSMPTSCYQLPTLVDFGWQPNNNKTEDCLYLNIWAPAAKSDKPRTVMVWLPGGAFIAGGISIDYYDGKELAAIGDVVVVEVNSRVGSLGYLNLNIPGIDGNQGLYDQHLALKWIRDNIANFGGDPEAVTLFGHSAGSVAVSFHLSSPLSRPLFKRAIMISGTSYFPGFALDTAASLKLSNELAVAVKCADDVTNVYTNPQAVIECLRKVPVFTLLKKESRLNFKLNFFYPSIGNAMLLESPIANLKKGNIKKTEILIGNILEEGTIFLNLLFPIEFFEENPTVNKSLALVMINTAFNTSGVHIPTLNEILASYFDPIEEEDDYVAVRKAVSDFYGDFVFFCPTFYWASDYSVLSPNVYYYVYTHPPSVIREKRQSWMTISHFDEVPYIFGFPMYSKLKYKEDEKVFSRQLVESWTNFAKTGSPRIGDYKNWPLYSQGNLFGMELAPGKKDSFLPNPSSDKCLNIWWPLFFSQLGDALTSKAPENCQLKLT